MAQGLRDRKAVSIIAKRLVRIEVGLMGDVKPVGEGVSEIRIDHGPGYRLYFSRHGDVILLLLCGGDKKTQTRDIRKEQEMLKEIKDENYKI